MFQIMKGFFNVTRNYADQKAFYYLKNVMNTQTGFVKTLIIDSTIKLGVKLIVQIERSVI